MAAVDVDLEAAERVAAAIGGDALALHADVTSSAAVDDAVEQTVERAGGLHIGVNNAGIGGARLATADHTDADWRMVMSVNLDGVLYSTRAEVRAMRSAGIRGSIINMSSIVGAVAFPTAPAYVTSKHGVLGLTRAAALDHAADGIRVNAVGPGMVSTPTLLGFLSEEELGVATSLHPLGRLGDPTDVAELVLWLASDASEFVTGSYYPIDGGYLSH